MVCNAQDLTLVPYPHPALRLKAKPVPAVTPLVQDVARRMLEVMHEHNGVGLAATQVAVPWRVFVCCVNDKDMVFINPQVTLGKNRRASTVRLQGEYETCLSLPGLHLEEKVFRSRDVYVEALDITGKPFTVSGPGLLARVVQHEADHLDGILFFDRLKLDGMLHVGEEVVSMRDYLHRWLHYLTTQYEFSVNSQKPMYGTYEEEVRKIAWWESVLVEKAA